MNESDNWGTDSWLEMGERCSDFCVLTLTPVSWGKIGAKQVKEPLFLPYVPMTLIAF